MCNMLRVNSLVGVINQSSVGMYGFVVYVHILALDHFMIPIHALPTQCASFHPSLVPVRLCHRYIPSFNT